MTRAAITSRAGQRGRQDGLTERAGLHPQLSSTNLPGGHIFGGGNCPGLPPTTPCRASRWPMGPGTLPRLGQSREASSTEGTITWPRGVRWSGCQGAGVFGLLSGGREQSGQRRWGPKEARKKPSGEGPERRQRGAPPRQDPCELISIGRQQGSAIRGGPVMLSGSAPGSGQSPTG